MTVVRVVSECPFWSGVEYQGLYECLRYKNVCAGCFFTSNKWYERLWFDVTVWCERKFIEVVNEFERFYSFLFNRKYYDLFYRKYWWDRCKRYYKDVYYTIKGRTYKWNGKVLIEVGKNYETISK